jgi:hypothetical protein
VLSTSDAALLVVTRRMTRRQDVLAADERIRRSGSHLVGTAVREAEAVREGAAPSPQPEHAPAALPSAGQPAIDTGPDFSSNVRVASGAGTIYHPDPRTQGEPPRPFAPEPPCVQPETEAPSYTTDTPPTAAPETLTDPVAAPLGWPAGDTIDGEVVNGARSGLGWPESQRAIN